MSEGTLGVNEGLEVNTQTEQAAAELENVETVETSELENQENLDNEEVDKQELPQEKAFAKRLSQERQKIAAEAKAEAQKEYARYMKLAEIGAKENGLSVDEYLNLIEQDAREKEEALRKEKYSGLTDEEIADLEWAKQNKPTVVQQQKTNQEVAELVEAYPNIKALEDIPPEVLELYTEGNLSLKKAYDMYQKLSGNKTQIEQQAIKKLQQNAKSSTGSLSQPATKETKSFSQMSKAEFEAYTERVKRGEIKKIE